MKASLVVSPRDWKHQNLGFYLENEAHEEGEDSKEVHDLGDDDIFPFDL
jgi:hypothetical protein